MKSYFLFVAFGLAIQAPRFSQEGQEILFHFIRQSTKKRKTKFTGSVLRSFSAACEARRG